MQLKLLWNNRMDSIKNSTPSPQACSLLCALDWRLSSTLNILVQAVIRMGLTLTGLAILIFSIVDRYEYGEGFADLSKFELIYSFIVFLLIMRVKAIIKKSTVPWWKAIFSPLILIGQLTVIILIVIGGLAFTDLINKTDTTMDILLFEETLGELVTYAVVLLGLYCGVPRFKTQIPQETNQVASEEQNDMQEPTLNPQSPIEPSAT